MIALIVWFFSLMFRSFLVLRSGPKPSYESLEMRIPLGVHPAKKDHLRLSPILNSGAGLCYIGRAGMRHQRLVGSLQVQDRAHASDCDSFREGRKHIIIVSISTLTTCLISTQQEPKPLQKDPDL